MKLSEKLPVQYFVNYTKKPLHEVLKVFRNNYVALEGRCNFIQDQHKEHAINLTVKYLL